jgi:hypothetical protein
MAVSERAPGTQAPENTAVPDVASIEVLKEVIHTAYNTPFPCNFTCQ